MSRKFHQFWWRCQKKKKYIYADLRPVYADKRVREINVLLGKQ